MTFQWMVGGAVALVMLRPGARPPLEAAGGTFVCPATAKPANLNFTLKNLDNADVKLSSFKGKVILLDFWATWCGPCKVEIPWFVDLQTRYGKQGLQVLGISVDDKLLPLKSYVAQYKVSYPVLQGLGHDDVMDAFGPMVGFPTTFVISPEGKICATHLGLSSRESFENQVKGLLPAGR